MCIPKSARRKVQGSVVGLISERTCFPGSRMTSNFREPSVAARAPRTNEPTNPDTHPNKPGTRNPEPGTRNPGTRNPEPGTRNPESRIQNPEHNTQHTTHNTQHTTHNTQHTTHNTQHTTRNTQHATRKPKRKTKTETKRNETKRNETKQNKTKQTTCLCPVHRRWIGVLPVARGQRCPFVALPTKLKTVFSCVLSHVDFMLSMRAGLSCIPLAVVASCLCHTAYQHPRANTSSLAPARSTTHSRI